MNRTHRSNAEGDGSVTVGARQSKLAKLSVVLGACGLFTCGLSSVAGLVFGIMAAVKIGKSGGKLTGSHRAFSGIAISAVTFSFVVFYITANGRSVERAHASSCWNNLKQLGLMAESYSVKNENALPSAGWCDLLLQQTDGEWDYRRIFICPMQDDGDYGYAYNINLVGVSASEVNPATVMLFESDAGWNATGGPELILQQPRHANVFIVGFADGSVRRVSPKEVQSLRWQP